MTFEEAVADLERGRTIVDGIPMAISETGERYIEFVSGYSEGVWEAIFLTEASAVENWHKQVMAYANGRIGVLYYRRRPEADFGRRPVGLGPDMDWEIGSKHAVYARFLISDKPVLDVYRYRAA